MSLLSVFLHAPLVPSLEEALPALAEKQLFSFHKLRLDTDLLPLLIEARPCICVFSISDIKVHREVCALLEKLRDSRLRRREPPRDPTLRIILIAEQRGFPIERWHELGVHEFIIAPVLPRALAYKISRHHLKAVSSDVSKPGDLDRLTPDVDEVAQRHQKAPREWVYHEPSKESREKEERLRKYKVVIPGTALPRSSGKWMLRGDGGGFDDTWVWVKDGAKPGVKQSEPEICFTGDQPRYDTRQNSWIFSGERPHLWISTLGQNSTVLQAKGGEDEFSGEPELIVCENEQLPVEEVRVQYYGFNNLASFNVYGGPIQDDASRSHLTAIGNAGNQIGDDSGVLSYLETWKPQTGGETKNYIPGAGKETTPGAGATNLGADPKQRDEKTRTRISPDASQNSESFHSTDSASQPGSMSGNAHRIEGEGSHKDTSARFTSPQAKLGGKAQVAGQTDENEKLVRSRIQTDQLGGKMQGPGQNEEASSLLSLENEGVEQQSSSEAGAGRILKTTDSGGVLPKNSSPTDFSARLNAENSKTKETKLRGGTPDQGREIGGGNPSSRDDAQESTGSESERPLEQDAADNSALVQTSSSRITDLTGSSTTKPQKDTGFRVKSGGEGPLIDRHRIKQDGKSDASQTWSMQNYDDEEAAKKRAEAELAEQEVSNQAPSSDGEPSQLPEAELQLSSEKLRKGTAPETFSNVDSKLGEEAPMGLAPLAEGKGWFGRFIQMIVESLNRFKR